jgi:hypothetical protein
MSKENDDIIKLPAFSDIAIEQSSVPEASNFDIQSIGSVESEPAASVSFAVRESDGDDASEEELEQNNEITMLSNAFRHLMNKLSNRVLYLAETTHKSVSNSHKRIELNELAAADRQIKELKDIIAQCEGLENELLKIRQIGEIANDFKTRIQVIEKAFGR